MRNLHSMTELAPRLMRQGYFPMPKRTVEAWRTIWFHSGDAEEEVKACIVTQGTVEADYVALLDFCVERMDDIAKTTTGRIRKRTLAQSRHHQPHLGPGIRRLYHRAALSFAAPLWFNDPVLSKGEP